MPGVHRRAKTLREQPKALGRKAWIEPEHVGETFGLHDDEAHDVHEAHTALVGLEEPFHCTAMQLTRYPVNRARGGGTGRP